MAKINITSGFYEAESLPLSHQKCLNWYVNRPQTPNALSEESLEGTFGLVQLTTTGALKQQNRGSWKKNGIPYFVNGQTLYKLDRSVVSGAFTYSAVSLGSIPGDGRVSMAANDSQLVIVVPGVAGYVYNEDAGTPFQEITDAYFTANGQPQNVAFIDGYFSFVTDEKKWIISALNDALNGSALDFGSAESDPDSIVTSIVVNNQIYILGTETTEGFQNYPVGSGFPFVRNNVILDKGCSALFAVVKTNQRFFMLGAGKDETPCIWEFTGTSFTKASTKAIDEILASYTDAEIASAFAWTYGKNGAFFVGFTFPDRAFVYNMATEKWHEQQSFVNEALSQWRVSTIVTAYGKTLVGDLIDGRIGELSKEIYSEYGENIIRELSFPLFTEDSRSFCLPNLELTMESGVGNEDVPEPYVSMAFSRDAKLFGPEKRRKIGAIGKYRQRIFWRKNGRFPRYAVGKIRLSDPVKPVVIKLEVT